MYRLNGLYEDIMGAVAAGTGAAASAYRPSEKHPGGTSSASSWLQTASQLTSALAGHAGSTAGSGAQPVSTPQVAPVSFWNAPAQTPAPSYDYGTTTPAPTATPWYKKPLVWVGIGGGTLAVVVLGVLVYRAAK